MVKKFSKLSKPAIIGIAVTAGLIVGSVGVSQSDAALDWLGIQQQIQHQEETLDNHEDRITNTEKDVKEVQENTGTQPSTEKVVVREVVTQAPVPTPEPPKPVTVVAFEVIPVADYFNCKHTYSDGTDKVFKWKWFGTTTTEQGQVFKTTSTSGYCDEKAIGLEKT